MAQQGNPYTVDTTQNPSSSKYTINLDFLQGEGAERRDFFSQNQWYRLKEQQEKEKIRMAQNKR